MPSVRVRKTYSTIGEPSRTERSSATPPAGNTVASRSSQRQSRRRTLRSVFRSGQAPGSENADSISLASARDPPPIVIIPQQVDEVTGYQPDNERGDGNTVPRSLVAQTVTRRRRASSATFNPASHPRAPSIDPYAAGASSVTGRSRGLSVSESVAAASVSRPIDNSHLAVPNSPESGVRALDRRKPSLVSLHGSQGASVGLIIPDGSLGGTVASAVGATQGGRRRDGSRGRDLEANSEGSDNEEADSSDYTTDGTDIDEEEHHLDEVVDHLDVIDPEVAMVSHLSNAANSILIPRLPMYSRRPVVTLPTLTPSTTLDSLIEKDEEGGEAKRKRKFPRRHHKDQDELDAHVEHVLKRRAKIRRALRGLWQFLKTPAGIVTAIYGFCVVFWGAAIVLFLVKWINLHNDNTQKFWIEISSQVVNALFTVTGVGLIPWRVMDTYRIVRIWHFKRLDRKLRKKQSLPPLEDQNELPDPLFDPNFTHVLTEQQQKELRMQQKRFTKSQTWYRAHATDTHRAFPIGIALAICLFVDANSVFQCLLCGSMWGLDRYNRPPWTTGLLIPAAFLCGIIAAVLIARGGHKTKKTTEVEERLRKALAQGRASRAEANNVYARRAGLVGIIPMPADDEGEAEGDESAGRNLKEGGNDRIN